MATMAYIKFCRREYRVRLYSEIPLVKRFIEYLPIESEANALNGQVYFRIPDAVVAYDGPEREDFASGDVVYGCDPDGSPQFTVTVLYGPTKYGNGLSCTTGATGVKIGEIIDDTTGMEEIRSCEAVSFFLD